MREKKKNTKNGTTKRVMLIAERVLHSQKDGRNFWKKKIDNSSNCPMKVIVDNAEKLSREADTEGITGFMYGCAVNILSRVWKYGDELRMWHNGKYDYQGEGTVNPAILTVGGKDD